MAYFFKEINSRNSYNNLKTSIQDVSNIIDRNNLPTDINKYNIDKSHYKQKF